VSIQVVHILLVYYKKNKMSTDRESGRRNNRARVTRGSRFIFYSFWLQEKLDEHGQGKWEGKQKGKSDKRTTESKARQKEALHCAQT
jgi:hypothetical protein